MQERKLSLGAAFKVARQNQQLTQTELSEELDISSRHLQAIENENKAPSYELLSKILNRLDIPTNTVLNSTDTTRSPEQELLIYLICNKCSERDVAVLLSTAEALVNTKKDL